MKKSTKYLALGGAMIATLGVVGTVQAHDRDNDRGGRHHGEYQRGDHGRGDHGRGHHRRGDGERGGRGHHAGGHGMMGGMMGGMTGGHGMMGGGHGQRMMMMRVFQLADTDGDRSVTQADIDAFLEDRMQQYDANGDGELQLEEYKALFAEFVEPMAVRSFQAMDPDGNASLTSDELGKRLSGVVERMDRDGDGKLTMQDRGRNRGDWRGERGERRERWGNRDRGGMMQNAPETSDDMDDEDETPSAQ